ncbi:MAG: DMT family transporter [Gammaproteobacteria bacterium]|nr:DMT family transporter [Gammaproteobacteria bacterium]
MKYLSAVTLLWAFSFSLIGVYLAGQVDPWFSAATRIALAGLVFLPFLRLKNVSVKFALQIAGVGAFQLGLMYCFYYQSFLYLTVPEVLLFTVLTPIYVTLLYDFGQRRFTSKSLLCASIAVIGAICIKYQGVNSGFITGFLIVQGANLSFAIGQVAYKQIIEQQPNDINQLSIFGLFYLGALAVALPMYGLFGDSSQLPTNNTQWGILVYLGIIASSLGYFAWNKGATLVSSGTLAVMNNALVPAGLIVNIVIWNRDADIVRLSIGGAIILFALWLNQRWSEDKAYS